MYHRIVDVPIDPRATAVAPSNFAKHADYIKRSCQPVGLVELAQCVQDGSLPHRAVAITFDDGYANNLRYAYPVLAEAQLPATVFVATGYINRPFGFWWDELDRILLLQPDIPDTLCLDLHGQEHRWQIRGQEERYVAYEAMRVLLRAATAEEREDALTRLSEWAGIGRYPWTDCRSISDTELRRLAKDRLIQVGAHTVTHPVLSSLPPSEQLSEIIRSRDALVDILGGPVASFAYPYGGTAHFGQEAVKIVQEAGFSTAVTTIPGAVHHGDDPLLLRRCAVRDWTASEFKRRLDSFFA